MGKVTRFSPEVRERTVRFVLEQTTEHTSQWGAVRSVADKIGCTRETLRRWVRQADRTPHVAKDIHARKPESAVDGRTTRHDGYDVNQTKRKRIEEGFGCGTTIRGLRKLHHRGREKRRVMVLMAIDHERVYSGLPLTFLP